jgi:hypothetical protein
MTPPCYLSQARASIVSRLQLFPDFATALPGFAPLSNIVNGAVVVTNGIPESVIVEKIRGNFLSRLQAMINTLGLVVMVEIASFKECGSQQTMATFDPVEVMIDVSERTVTNANPGTGSGWPALDFTERAIAALKWWQPPQDVSGGLYPARLDIMPGRNVSTLEEQAAGLDHWVFGVQFKISTTARTTP